MMSAITAQNVIASRSGHGTDYRTGLYIAPDADVPEAYRGIGVRIEDDIVITADGNENLTASVVKTADDIEALMAQAKQAE